VPAHGEKSPQEVLLSQRRKWPDKQKFLKAAHACVLDTHWFSHGWFIGKHVVIPTGV